MLIDAWYTSGPMDITIRCKMESDSLRQAANEAATLAQMLDDQANKLESAEPAVLPQAELTDSAGDEWDPAVHASTRAKNRDGTWAKKRGRGAKKKPPFRMEGPSSSDVIRKLIEHGVDVADIETVIVTVTDGASNMGAFVTQGAEDPQVHVALMALASQHGVEL